jgi:uncharacterized protein YdeI (YjbR/CyaY-like superfamily)
MNLKFFNTPSQFRRWLERNHDKVSELWLGLHNQRSDKTSITYKQALDEALCFGWIDGVRKSVSDTTYKIRFTPRKAVSKWSAVNIKRAGELIQLKRMASPGLAAFQNRRQHEAGYSYENRPTKLDPGLEKQFKSNPKAWLFFTAQAPWYQRTSCFWVLSAKKEETRLKRLRILIADSEQGRKIGLLTRTIKQ